MHSPEISFYKTRRNFPQELDSERVWAVVPLTRPDPKMPGITHSARWYATRAEDTCWTLCDRAPGALLPGRPTDAEVALFEALPFVTDEEIDALIGVPAYRVLVGLAGT